MRGWGGVRYASRDPTKLLLVSMRDKHGAFFIFIVLFFFHFYNEAHVLLFRFGLKTDAPSIERRRKNVSQCIAIRTMKARMSTLHPPIR